MSIRINKSKCIGCKMCSNICPGNLIFMNEENKAYIRYPKDCWGCTSCLKECNFSAIEFFLGSDIGGKGYISHTEISGDIIKWIIEDGCGYEEIIEIDKNKSNSY